MFWRWKKKKKKKEELPKETPIYDAVVPKQEVMAIFLLPGMRAPLIYKVDLYRLISNRWFNSVLN